MADPAAKFVYERVLSVLSTDPTLAAAWERACKRPETRSHPRRLLLETIEKALEEIHKPNPSIAPNKGHLGQ